MSKRSYADLVAQYEKRKRRKFNWSWLGWLGLLCVVLFVSFIFYPTESDFLKSQPASVMIIGAMIAGIVLPVLASVRESKWWLLVSLCGVLASVYFFLVIGT